MLFIRFCLVIIPFFIGSALAQSKLTEALKNLNEDPVLRNATIGFCAVETETGKIIAENQANLSIPTASTTKLFATASAIEILGPNYAPTTRIYFTQKPDANGIVLGDVWIRGGGDISLGSRYYNESGKEADFLQKWADTLFKMGVRSIHGDLIGDASEFGYQGIPDGWGWSDIGNYYGSGPSGLPIFDNMLRYYFKVNGNLGAKAELLRTFPEIEGLQFNSYIVGSKQSGDNSYIFGGPFSNYRFGNGHLPINSNNFMVKGSLPDPELQFATELRKALIARGIQISGKAIGARNLETGIAWKRYSTLHLFFTNKGQTVQSIAFWTNQKSVNVFAEQLVCWIGYQANGHGDTENGINQLEKYWKGKIPTEGLYLTDGSGLSRSNAISAKHFCDLLVYMHRSKNNQTFLETLPIAGISGTLKDVCQNQAAHGKIYAKSGTMKRIKSYAGYAFNSEGKKIAFAITINNYNTSNEQVLRRIEKVMNALVS